MADAVVSKTTEGNLISVRLRSPAPNLFTPLCAPLCAGLPTLRCARVSRPRTLRCARVSRPRTLPAPLCAGLPTPHSPCRCTPAVRGSPDPALSLQTYPRCARVSRPRTLPADGTPAVRGSPDPHSPCRWYHPYAVMSTPWRQLCQFSLAGTVLRATAKAGTVHRADALGQSLFSLVQLQFPQN